MENKLNEELLLERTRQSLNVQNKSGADYAGDQSKGRNRFERKKYSSLSKSVRAYNQMDMNNLFKNDILTLTLEVHGETDNYKVKVKFGGIINELQKEIKLNNNKIDYKCVHYALHRVFNSEDVYINCNCKDFFYTFLHHADKGGYSSINQDPGPGMGIRNPNNDKGAGCKHTALVLSKIDWLLKVSSTLSNYIHYMEEHQERLYAKLMFPKLYGMSYDKAVQLDLFDNGRDYLKHSKQELDKSNEEGKDRGKFQKGNTSGMRFSKSTGEVEDENQLELDLDNNTESEE